MIEKCANAVTVWLIKSEVIEETERELYVYAAYSFFMTVSPLFLAILFGMITGHLQQSMAIIITFMIIRKFSGGYHAKYSWMCLIESCLLLLLCIWISSYVKCSMGLLVATLWALVSLVLCSPVDSENRRLDSEEVKWYRKVTIAIVFSLAFLCVLFYLLELYTYTICVSIGMILSAGLQAPCVIQRFMNKNTVRM